jgi:hypothetical protein
LLAGPLAAILPPVDINKPLKPLRNVQCSNSLVYPGTSKDTNT